jgi:hypothetical protein
VKPSNILFEAGRARVADFGVAKALEGAASSDLTSGAFAVGTLAYMSPEQAAAPAGADHRCDVYALAAVAYEMLTGQVPFESANPAVMLAQKSAGTFRPLRDFRLTIPEAVEGAILRGLHADPSARFQSVRDFVAAIRGASQQPVFPRRVLRLGKPRLAVLLAVSAALATVAIAAWRQLKPLSVRPAVGLGRIAVAPLRNATGRSTLDPVGLMAADWLAEGLERAGVLEVAPPVSVFELDSLARKESAPAHLLAEETGAGSVITGAYYLRNDSLLFRLQISDEGGRRLDGVITDVACPVSDPIRGVEELRNRVMGWLAVRYDERLNVTSAQVDRPPTYAAYLAFSDGMSRYLASQNVQAFPLFLAAYNADTTFVPALLYASFALTNVADFRRADSVLQLVDGRRAELSEYDRAWLDFRIAIVRGNGEMAVSAMRTAAHLAPRSKAAYNHAVAAFQNRYVHEALASIEGLEPERGPMRGFASYWSIYGSIVHALGDYDREQGIGVAARAAYPQRMIAFPPLIRALAAKGQVHELDVTLRAARALPPDPFYWDYGLLLTEAAEELRAHGHSPQANVYFKELHDWASARDTTRSMRWRAVQASYALGDLAAAGRELVSLRGTDPSNLEYLGMRGLIDARSGQYGAARAVIDSLGAAHAPYSFGVPSLFRARIAARIGNKELAISALQDSFAQGRPFQVWLHRDADLAVLAGFAPFDQLLRSRD